MLVEKFRRCMIRPQPVLVPQKIVNLVGIDKLFKIDTVGSQPPHQIDGLGKLNIAIVVAMNQKQRRLLFFHRKSWRRLAGDPIALRTINRNSQAGDRIASALNTQAILSPCFETVGS
jgi:hypothetical protein